MEHEKSEMLVEKQEVKETPFTLVKTEEKVLIVMGNQVMTDKEFSSFEEAEEFIKEKPWQLLWTMCAVICNNLLPMMLNNDKKRIQEDASNNASTEQ